MSKRPQRSHFTAKEIAAARQAPPFDPVDMPTRFGMRVAGNCMSPLLDRGNVLMLDKSRKPEPGDIVAIFLRPEAIDPEEPFQADVKRLVRPVAHFVKFPFTSMPRSEVMPFVEVESINPRQRYRYPCSEILALFVCTGRFVSYERPDQRYEPFAGTL